ncbi:MAG TPA: 16S rRNA (uracil(1498)-N(3))-methyltransferase [Kofleriaceae bacterium]|nr:16S rRNA (uracil(1498)-N(3))-methyltransferase [Kofleriaceae bacterium]
MAASLLVAPARLAAGRLEVTGDDHAYLFRVRRLAVGDPVRIFDGAGREAAAVVLAVTGTSATLEVGAPEVRTAAGPRITVVQAVIKGERMDWCLEKLVEVGADAIVPCETARTVVRLDDDRRARRGDRYQAIAREAARQCGRADVPAIAPIAVGVGVVDRVVADVRLVAHPGAHDRPLLDAVPASATEIAILIGPEGGLTTDEVETAIQAGFVPVSLGPHVLRAETAGVAAVAAIRAKFAQAPPAAV